MHLSKLVTLAALSLAAACGNETMTTSPDASPNRATLGAVADPRFSHDVLACEEVEFFRAQPSVSGRNVDVAVRIQGTPFHGTWGRIVFWPEGRHQGAKIVSDVFETGYDDDFPVERTLSHLFPPNAPSGPRLGNLDYEMLLKCFDETQERFVFGWFDEFGFCREDQIIVLQCDRGVSYTLP